MSDLEQSDPVLQPELGQMIKALNQHISSTGESIEGNVCYWNDTPAEIYRDQPPTDDPMHMAKRANLAILARRRSSAIEIGLNGGHSALIALSSNPRLHFFSVDIVGHRYTQLAADFLKANFGRRFHFFAGDSRDVMPRLAVESPALRFDLLHVDGGHGVDLAYTDISNCLRMAETGGDLVFDDVNAPQLNAVLEIFIRLGYLEPLKPQTTLFPTPLHEVLTVRRGAA